MNFTIFSKYPYADIRIEQGTEDIIKISNKEVKTFSGDFYGISARVLVSGSWGFASSNKKCDPSELLRKAEKLARLKKGKIKLKRAKPVKKKIKSLGKISSIEHKIVEMKESRDLMKGKNIRSMMVSSVENDSSSEFYSSEGAEIIQDTTSCYFSCSAIAKKGDNMQKSVETAGSLYGFRKINTQKMAETARKKAQRLLIASLPPKGRFTVVLDPEMTGVFTHEVVGHASEGDSIIERESILSHKLGKRIGNPLVNIVDDPTYVDFGHYIYDDEGIKAKKVHLIKKGKLVNYLNSSETAQRLKHELNGHCRAASYDSFPIVRMSNTFFLPGKSSLSDVFDVKDGIYVKGMRGGSVDPFSGNFMFKAGEAFLIKNGEKRKSLRDVSISGNILKILKNIESVGKDFETSPGFCSKMGQDIGVSDGGPHVRIKDVLVG